MVLKSYITSTIFRTKIIINKILILIDNGLAVRKPKNKIKVQKNKSKTYDGKIKKGVKFSVLVL